MATNNFLDQAGLDYLWTKIANAISTSTSATEKKIPSKVSQLENDKKYITLAEVPSDTAISAETIRAIVNGTYS
jgi:hypothetical protein